MGDFNMTTSNPMMSQFLNTIALSPVNVDPVCFENSKKSNLYRSFAYKFQT